MTRAGSAGILMPVFSLPADTSTNHGAGDFGPGAYRFADWLRAAGMSFWQVLPFGPTDPFYGNSPYRSRSSFALSPLYLSPELLVKDGLLRTQDLKDAPRFPVGKVDYERVVLWKQLLLDRIWARSNDEWRMAKCEALTADDEGRMSNAKLRDAHLPRTAFRRFCRENAHWLDDYALFTVLKHRFGGAAWTDWPEALRRRHRAALEEAVRASGEQLRRIRFEQFLLSAQWDALKRHCNRLGISIIGDLPIYADLDSADVWARQELFQLDGNGRPRFVAGAPPDYFSATGQLWGNPVYRWREHQRTGFGWWMSRIRHQLRLFDSVRIDHFRGLVAYWRVPAGAETAASGRWMRAPARPFLSAVKERFPQIPFIAEDLGVITPDVVRVRTAFGLPGTRVLLFAFDGDKANPHRPENVGKDVVYYTGTHDNNTCRGWYEREATEREKAVLAEYLGGSTSGPRVSRAMTRLCLRANARWVMIPLQDALGLGATARVNTPATTRGNWQWRLGPSRLTEASAAHLRRETAASGRA